MVFRKLACLLAITSMSVVCPARSSFLKSYELPNQYIQRVSTVACLLYSYPPYVVALEGVNTITNEFFTRVQAFDYDGNLAEGYEDAFVGNPLSISSGLFEIDYHHHCLLAPVAEYSQDSLRYYMRWQTSTPDSSYAEISNFVFLPDSIQTIYDFPAAINRLDANFNGTESYLIGGRALVNGVNRCFLINAYNRETTLNKYIVYFPGLNFISGVVHTNDGFLAIGRSTGWTGKAVLVGYDNSVLWQQDFTDAADTAFEPNFTAPLINSFLPGETASFIISYQTRDRIMHLESYANQSLTEIFSLQLDSYIGAIPVNSDAGNIAFCYVNNGHQYISQCDFFGNLLWTTELPGVGKFGRNSLDFVSIPGKYSYYLVGSVLPGGGFYLAAVNAWDGSIDNDSVHIPEVSDVRFYPNPAGEWVNSEIDVKQYGRVKIALYNIKGQKVRTLVDENFSPGKYRGRWNLGVNGASMNRVLSSGLYILHSEINGKKFAQKLILHPDNEASIPPTLKRSH
jgi:hypothetical protein